MTTKTAVVPSMTRGRRRLWLTATLAVALACTTSFVGEARAGIYGPTEPPVGSVGPRSRPTAQECFSNYISNSNICIAVWCDEFLWLFTFNCKEPQLTQCTSHANDVFELCMEAAGA